MYTAGEVLHENDVVSRPPGPLFLEPVSRHPAPSFGVSPGPTFLEPVSRPPGRPALLFWSRPALPFGARFTAARPPGRPALPFSRPPGRPFHGRPAARPYFFGALPVVSPAARPYLFGARFTATRPTRFTATRLREALGPDTVFPSLPGSLF